MEMDMDIDTDMDVEMDINMDMNIDMDTECTKQGRGLKRLVLIHFTQRRCLVRNQQN
jgi:hypothetical protein